MTKGLAIVVLLAILIICLLIGITIIESYNLPKAFYGIFLPFIFFFALELFG